MLRAWIVALLLVLANYANAQNVSGSPISKLPQATLPLSGNEVFPLVQNGVAKQTPVNNASTSVPFLASGIGATFSATSPTRAGRGADAKLDFGAICDGRSHTLSGSYSSLAAAQIDYPQALDLAEEKDTAAISQLISVFRASTGAFGPVARLNAVNLGACVINRTLPLYSIRTAGARLYWSGTKLICYGNSPGLICVDGAMNEFATWYDFTLNGQAANFISGSVPPKVGLFVGRDSVADRANNNNYIGLDIENHFTLASLDNFSSEVLGASHFTLSNTEPNAYALSQDGCNHFGVASPTLGNTAPIDSPVSFYSNAFTAGSAAVTGAGSYPVFMCHGYGHHFNDMYNTGTGGSSPTQANIRIWSNSTGVITGDETIDLEWRSHDEGGTVGMAAAFSFAGPNTTPIHTNLTYHDGGFGALINIFKAEAEITSVTLPGLDFAIGNIHNGQVVFDQPSLYHVTGNYGLGNAPLQSMWNLPTTNWKGCLTAVNTVKCQLDGNFQPYGMNVSLGAGGGLNIASAGSIASLAITSPAGYGANTSGTYSFPGITISAPDVAGGTQATGHVVDWALFAAPAIGGGSAWVPGGTGYTVNDVLTLPGGTCSVQPQIKVLTVDGGGGVLTWQKQTTGNCTAAMAMPVALTGGTGTGASLSRVAWTPNSIAIDNAGTGYLAPTVTFGDVVYNNASPPEITSTVTPATVSLNGNPIPIGVLPTSNDTRSYALWPISATTSAAAPSQNIARCTPFKTDFTIHVDQISMTVSTLGTGPLNVALYSGAIDATTSIQQPQTPLWSGTFTVTGTGTATAAVGTSGVGVTIPAGLNWDCTNDTNATDAVRFPAIPGSSTYIANLIGSSTPASTTSASANITSMVISEPAGTWPSFIGATFTDSAGVLVPLMTMRVAARP